MQGTIVIAEKSTTVAKMVEISLAKHPFKLVFATDSAQAIAAVKRESPILVIVDAALPGDGYETAAALKAEGSAKVLLLVGRSKNLDITRARDAQIDGHLPKPFLTQQLVEKVFTTLGQPVPDKVVFRSTTMSIPLASDSRKPVKSAPPVRRPRVPETPSSRPRMPSAPPSMGAPAFSTPPAGPPLPLGTPSRGAPSMPPAAALEMPAPRKMPPPAARKMPPPATRKMPPAAAARKMPPPAAHKMPSLPPRDTETNVPFSGAVQSTLEKMSLDTALLSALSGAERKIIERIAWEVIPRLAETILKEQIALAVREQMAAS